MLLCTQNDVIIKTDSNDVINYFALIKAGSNPLCCTSTTIVTPQRITVKDSKAISDEDENHQVENSSCNNVYQGSNVQPRNSRIARGNIPGNPKVMVFNSLQHSAWDPKPDFAVEL
ncbi:hypothetical protein TNCV_4340171 [Trichonephila clavipes]|nr:hypothetical protein TNCV_4340171 [Trichonephila clavipes]